MGLSKTSQHVQLYTAKSNNDYMYLTMVWLLELHLCLAHFVNRDKCPAHFVNLALANPKRNP